jgi:hypothetical protein
MDADVGDRIEVTTNTLGVPPRYGEVIERSKSSLRVRWDDGHESVFVPSSNCRVIEGGDPTGPTRLSCHIDVDVVEDSDECQATATLTTTRGIVQASGRARRNPVDPAVPMVGEELAIGRAIRSLGEQLIAAGGDDLADPPTAERHLVGRT